MTTATPATGALSPRLVDLLSAEVIAKLDLVSTAVSYADGQLIHSRGDDKPGVSIVREGAVHIGSYGQDGSFITTTVFGKGQCFGEQTVFSGLPRTHDVFAVGNAIVDQIAGPDFLAIFDAEPSLGRALLIVSQIRMHLLGEELDDLRRLPLPVRAVKYLLSAKPDHPLNTLPATSAPPLSTRVTLRQSDMAFALGVSRVSIAKALKRLQQDGLITLGYGHISLGDVDRLKGWVAARSAVTPLRAKLD